MHNVITTPAHDQLPPSSRRALTRLLRRRPEPPLPMNRLLRRQWGSGRIIEQHQSDVSSRRVRRQVHSSALCVSLQLLSLLSCASLVGAANLTTRWQENGAVTSAPH